MPHDIEIRDAIIRAARLGAAESEVERLEAEVERLEAEVERLEAEVERLKEELNNEEFDAAYWREQTAKAAARERAAVVAWMGEMIANYRMVEHSECWPEDTIEEIKKDIEHGEHWPEE